MKYDNRKYVFIIMFLAVGIIFIFRLFYMQIVSTYWDERAETITKKKYYVPASRGIIYDRNGDKLVDNKIYYDLMIIPDEVGEIDTLALCNLLELERETFDKKLDKAIERGSFAPSIFMSTITKEWYATKQENLRMNHSEAFFVQERTLRTYPSSIAGHILGYLNITSREDLDNDKYYKLNDFIGVAGIEKAYEKELRGKRGVRYFLKTAKEIAHDSYEGGKYDTLAQNGADLIATLDAELQAYGEELMVNKTGSIVAIEPKTGEVLAMVTAPGYDPNGFVGKARNTYYPQLYKDTLKPLLNRAVFSTYPPGSIFKMFQALIGMDLGILTPQSSFFCDGSLIGDHIPTGNYQMYDAIKSSSNQWFLLALRKIVQQGKFTSHFKDAPYGLDIWAERMKSFGLGQKLPLEIEGVNAGLIPDSKYYNGIYGEGRWAYSTIRSISIGQGEVLLTPLQMANLGCVLANKGYYYYPHFIKDIAGEGKRELYTKKNVVSKDSSNYSIVWDAMQAVIEEPGGTARMARTDSITICGKTGTAENPHGEDHSVFLAFAPRENPKIAIAVYVEHAKWGGSWAAPISALMIEKYLKGYITDKKKEKYILEGDFIHKKE